GPLSRWFASHGTVSILRSFWRNSIGARLPGCQRPGLAIVLRFFEHASPASGQRNRIWSGWYGRWGSCFRCRMQRMTCGVSPPGDYVLHKRLFDALEDLFPVIFEGRSSEQLSGTNAFILFGGS